MRNDWSRVASITLVDCWKPTTNRARNNAKQPSDIIVNVINRMSYVFGVSENMPLAKVYETTKFSQRDLKRVKWPMFFRWKSKTNVDQCIEPLTVWSLLEMPNKQQHCSKWYSFSQTIFDADRVWLLSNGAMRVCVRARLCVFIGLLTVPHWNSKLCLFVLKTKNLFKILSTFWQQPEWLWSWRHCLTKPILNSADPTLFTNVSLDPHWNRPNDQKGIVDWLMSFLQFLINGKRHLCGAKCHCVNALRLCDAQ